MLALPEIFRRVEPAPKEWFEGIPSAEPSISYALPPLPCDNYGDLIKVWNQAMYWTDSLDVALVAMLAVVASTKQQGSQIWIRLIGVAGSAKTMLCEAVCANGNYVYPMSLTTGLHSGYTQGGEDHSMIPRLNGKTAVVNEGDMLLKAPNKEQTMAELRDLWSGQARCDFKNGKHENYQGLRITFILAGTNTLRQLNRSALGDRFLDCIVYERKRETLGKANQHESNIVRSAIRKQRVRTRTESDGKPESYDEPSKIEAKQRTAGYVQYLRENAAALLAKLDQELDDKTYAKLENDCHDLASLIAMMRTRPMGSGEEPTEPELATRLGEQVYRFMACIAVVMGRSMDGEVMRRVAKIANYTCYGDTFEVCKALMDKPLDEAALAVKLHKSQADVITAIKTLREIGCIQPDTLPAVSGALGRGRHVYRLSPYVAGLLVRLRELLSLEPAGDSLEVV